MSDFAFLGFGFLIRKKSPQSVTDLAKELEELNETMHLSSVRPLCLILGGRRQLLIP